MTLPIDAPETRLAATEIKFVLDTPHAARVRAWAREHLVPDPHGAGAHGDAYRTTTLYLDTAALDVYYRQGSYGRAKYRVRRYGTSDVAFLERKLRRPKLLVKRRTPVALGLVEQLADGALPAGAPGHWFVRRLEARRLAPACLVAYTRTARLGAADGAPVRLTLDDDIRAWPARGFSLDTDGEGRPALPDGHILELKFRGRLPAIFRRLVQDLALSPRGVSKYRLATVALGRVDAAPDTLAAAAGGARYA